MELDLKMQEVGCCEAARRVVVSHEETMETAIPEYCPDVARIVDTVGQLKIREKKMQGARLTISGTVRTTVLYTSEESAGLRSLTLSVQFSCTVDDERLRGCSSVCGSGRLQMVEARAVGARKIYIRALAEFEVEGILCPNRRICCDVPEDPALQVRRCQREVRLLSRVLEREFSFHQECRPGPDDGVPEDLLLDRLTLHVTGCQRLSSKLIVKGEAALSLLYRTKEQRLDCCDLLLPFSQVVDGAELPEQAEYCPEVWVQDSDVRLIRMDDGVGFGVSARIGLVLKVYEQILLDYVEDLYSTADEVKTQRHCSELTTPLPPEILRQETVQTLEFGQREAFACITALECGGVTVAQELDGTVLRTELHLQLLYLDESGTPVSTQRTAELEIHTPLHPEAARAVCAPVIVHNGPQRCEIRIPVDFFLYRTELTRLDSVSAAELLPAEGGERPSVVLRRTEKGESLWEIAKAYRTAPAVIESANHLEQGAPLSEGMLLIPRVRT